ncbi:MAG: hypothetical protein V1702_06585 [Candidatus Woesearchaeota archaeon]
MPLQPQRITTEADTLITLLQQTKEMPLKEAAQRLKIPQETLEAWASFLEEEGIVAIKYKFTTPYLSYVGTSDKKGMKFSDDFKKKLDLAEKGGDMEHIESVMQSIEALIRTGDFPKLPDNYDSLITKIKSMNEHISEKRPENARMLDSSIQEIESALEQAHSLVDSGKFDDATKNYVQIHAMLADIMLALKSLQAEVMKRKISETSDIQTLLEEAYTLMSQGKTEEANEIYQQLDNIYKALPHNYVEKKHEIEKTMAKLNKDLAASLDKKRIAAVQEGSTKITGTLAKGNGFLKQNNLAEAEKSYLSAREIFTSLPPGFLAQKRKLQAGLIKLYEEISAARERLFMAKFNAAAQQLQVHLQRIYSLLQAGSVNEALSAYGSAKKTFDLMPSGFLNEKLALQSKLLEAYNQLVSAYQASSTSEMQKKTEQINSLLTQVGAAASSGIYDEASKFYSDVREVFKSLPAGFLKEKTELQQRILDAYEMLITVSGKQVTLDVRNKVDEVNKILDEAFNYLKHKREGLAHELYFQAINLYNKMPSGFLQSKAQLRSRMLMLYRELISKLDTPAREDFTESAESKYREILKLIVNVRHYIAKKQFDLIEPEYRNIVRLFSQLPLGFAQRSTQVLKEIKEIGQEAKLYNLLNRLPSVSSEQELKQALDDIYSIRQFVARECVEDSELINYAQSVYNQHLQRLTAKQNFAPKPFSQQAPPQPAPTVPEAMQPPQSLDELQEKISQLKQKAKPDVVMPGHDSMR